MLDLDSYLLRAFLAVAEIGTVSVAAVTAQPDTGRRQHAASQAGRSRRRPAVSALVQWAFADGARADHASLCPRDRYLADEAGKRLSGKTIRDRVRLGVGEDFAAGHLIEILRNFRDQNPDIEINIIIEPNRQRATLFNDGVIDLAVCDVGCLSRKPTLL